MYNIWPKERFIVKVIQEYLGYGDLVEEGNKEVVIFKVEKFKLISKQIRPLLKTIYRVVNNLIFPISVEYVL